MIVPVHVVEDCDAMPFNDMLKSFGPCIVHVFCIFTGLSQLGCTTVQHCTPMHVVED